jgi:transaldolase
MRQTYFRRVHAETANRFWINNPTIDEARKAIEAGAVGCTSNPAYVSKLLVDPAEKRSVEKTVDEVISAQPDDSLAAREVQRRMVARLATLFRPVYDATGGTLGFQTIQSDPFMEESGAFIRDDALRNREIAPNILCKIPSTVPGIAAMAELVPMGVPVMMTEIMAIDQAVTVCETYMKAAASMAKKPPFFVTHITGILDDYFKAYVEKNGITIDPAVLKQAGLAVAKKQYKLVKERGYPGIVLGGGARGLHHFTELVGSEMHVTINWKGTADALLAADGPVERRMDAFPAEDVVAELSEKIPDFRRAYTLGSLGPEEYFGFGGVELFRSSFLKGWSTLLAFIAARRAARG